MSFDGQSMWAGNTNVRGLNGRLVQIPMDGSDHSLFMLPARHHDFVVRPDGRIVTIEFEGNTSRECDLVREFDPATGDSQTIYQVQLANPTFTGQCHSNAINWWPAHDLFTLSVLNWSSIIAFTEAGDLQWLVGGTQSDFTGAHWSRQHQHQLLEDTLLLFNNEGADGGSDVLEYRMGQGSVELLSRYSSGLGTATFGDVKRLSTGNVLVTYSNAGVIQELSSEYEPLRQIETESIGYTVRRTSLYGPPPPYDE
jgi:hypothetical protein